MENKYLIDYRLFLKYDENNSELLEQYAYGIVYIQAISEEFARAKFHTSFAKDILSEIINCTLIKKYTND